METSSSRAGVLLIAPPNDAGRALRRLLPDAIDRAMPAVWVNRLRTARARLAHARFDAILVDVSDRDDRSALPALENLLPSATGAPVVVIDSVERPEIAAAALRMGAQDYVLRDQLDDHTLERIVRHAISRQRRVDALEDATRQAQQQASRDSLTGLANRSCFLDHLQDSVAYARRYDHRFGLLFIDLDHLKQINDGAGHAAGDAILRAIGERLPRCLRSSDLAGRIGGDEFAVLLRNLACAEDATLVAAHVLDSLARPVECNGHCFEPSTSIGIAIYPDDAADASRLLQASDAAMYAAKASGRSRYRRYREGLVMFPEPDGPESA